MLYDENKFSDEERLIAKKYWGCFITAFMGHPVDKQLFHAIRMQLRQDFPTVDPDHWDIFADPMDMREVRVKYKGSRDMTEEMRELCHRIRDMKNKYEDDVRYKEWYDTKGVTIPRLSLVD